LSEEQRDFAEIHRAEAEGLRLELEAIEKAYRDKQAELVLLQREADARHDSLLSEVEQWKAACAEYQNDAEQLRRWRHVRKRIAPEGSVRHSVLGAAATLTQRIIGARKNRVRVDLRNTDLVLNCEEPNIDVSPKLSGFICVSGWAAPKHKVSSIEILIDGARVGNAFYGFARPDVIRSHPEFGDDVRVGFAFRLDTTKFSAGMHSLKVITTSKDGKTATREGDCEVLAEELSRYPYTGEPQNPLLEVPIEVSENPTETSVDSPDELVQVSVAVFTRNQAELLSRSLPLIINQKTSFKFEVIGFDTESNDGTSHVFRRHGARVVSVRKNEFHHVRTRLKSLREARGPFVVFVVGDALPADDHWLEALVRPLIEDPLVAAAYSRQLPAPGCVPWEARDIYLGCSAVREVKQVNWSQPADVENYRAHQWKFISFSDVSACYRRELLESLPVLDALPQVEDQYWCKCLLEGGYRVVLEPTSLVIHSHNHSLRELYRRQVMFGRCFATFMDVQPEPIYHLIFRAVHDSVDDCFFTLSSRTNWLRTCKWFLQIPVMRLVKRYGLRQGFRLGAFDGDKVASYKFFSAQTTEIPVPTERSK
jgi:rhamnosyltransferase